MFIVTVEADDEKAARQAALSADVELVVSGEDVQDWEWAAHERITQGNVLYARYNEMTVEKEDDEEEG
jgi:hypothetical protein